MKAIYTLLFGLFALTGWSQPVRFTFEGDSTTIPFVRDSLRGLSGLEIIPATGSSAASEWHFTSDRGWYYVFTNIRSFRDLSDASRLKLARRTPYWFESLRHNESSLAGKPSMYFWTDEHRHVTSLMAGPMVSDSGARVLLKMPLMDDHRNPDDNNKGLEAIALTDSGRLWVAPEAGWEGQTDLTQYNVTFYRYANPLAADPVVERFTYPINRCPTAKDAAERLGGISEILALDEKRLLVLERCYDGNQVNANLYLATPDESSHRLTKEKVFDFNQDFPGTLCNLEAMAWADAQKQTLVVLADDNFRKSRSLRNQLILLRRR